jgi:hypothetical protein
MRPIIALLSDFGARDHYAGVMKGVILGICQEATLVDVSHDLPRTIFPLPRWSSPRHTSSFRPERSSSPSSTRASAARAAAWRPRRGLAVRRAGQRRHDGSLSGDAAQAGRRADGAPVRTADGQPDVRRTGSIRAGGGVACERDAAQALGRLVTDYQMLDLPRPRLEEGVLRGSVVRVDRFGNIVTNLDRRSCERLADGTRGLQLTVRGQSIARLVSTYSDIAPGEIGALFGSTDHLECAAHAASAAEQLGVAVGDPVELRRA